MGTRTKVPPGKQRVRVAEGVYLKANGKYLATFRDPGRKQRWAEFETKTEAERWRAQGRLDPRALQMGRRSLAEVWTTLLDHQGGNLRPTTRKNWEQEWGKYLNPALGTWPVGKITIPVVKDFLSALERKGVGASTRHKCRSLLHRILEEAVEKQEIGSNPVGARGTRVKRAQTKKARILSPEEVARVLAAARKVAGESDALAIECMFFLGLRIGEMAGLQARDIDTGGHEVVIRRTVTDMGGELRVQEATKTNEYRVLPLPAELPLWTRLEAHVRKQAIVGRAHVFRTSQGGVIRPNNWRRRVWAKVMEEAKIPDPPTPHSGRRTTASLLSAGGVPASTVQAILGHSTLQQTGEYIDVPRKEMEAGLRRLSAVYKQ